MTWTGAWLDRGKVSGLGLAAAVLLVCAACWGGGRGLERPAGSALWLDAASGAVPETAQTALAAVGVEEVFLEVAELSWSPEGPELTVAWPDTETLRTPVTLVVGGRAPEEGSDPEAAAESLAEGLRRLLLDAQTRGLIPRGYHLHLSAAAQHLPTLSLLLEELAPEVDPSLFLSATLDRRLLGRPEAERVARAADFLVVFLYGQLPGEEEDPLAWDLTEVARELTDLQRLGVDYLLGVVTLGQMTWLDRAGQLRDSTTQARLRDLVETRALETTTGFSLEGIDRQVFSYKAAAVTRLRGWRLAEGDRVRVSRLTGAHVRRLQERLEEEQPAHHLGEVYYRPPRPEERLSLTLAALAGALGPATEPPAIEARLAPGGRQGGGFVLRVGVHNPGSDATDIARFDSNYVELRARRGSFGRVQQGSFPRYDLLDGSTGRRTLRRPDTLRFYVPVLEAGESVLSGPVFVAGARGEEDVEVGGVFLLQDGRKVPVVARMPEPGPPSG